MGHGYVFQCKRCRYKLEADLGIGFMTSRETEETVRKMKSGAYGEKAEEFFRNNPDGTVDCSNVLFQCEKCGALKVDMGLAMYKRKEGTPEPEYHFPDAESYVKAEEFGHICGKCGSKMKELNTAHLIENAFAGKVRCPRCGGKLEIKDVICWD